MTKILCKPVKCIKCGKESDQVVVYSVNFLLGSKKDNKKLMNNQQQCPYCGYKATHIDREE